MKRIILVTILIGVFVALFIFFQYNIRGRTFLYGINLDTSGMSITETYTEEIGNNKVWWTIAESGDTKLYLGRSSPESPEKYISDRIYFLMSIYESSKSPYPDTLTSTLDCPSEYKPIEEEIENGRIFKILAGERLNYGVCTKDLVKYVSYYGLFDCGNKGVFEVKTFSNHDNIEANTRVRSFSCN